MNDRSATSPVSTGGGGTIFEQNVDALFLALLLVRAPLPILKDCQAEEVHLQAEHLGWKTDDVLVIAMRPDGVPRRLAAQVKRQFTISENDKICKEAFSDFWADFNCSKFDFEKDRFALITLRGTNVLLNGFNSLLDCARASADAADFMGRLKVNGFLSKTARGYAETIRRILDDAYAAPTDEQFWRFLSVLHVVSLDLGTATAQNEAWIKALLAATARGGESMTVAEASWLELLQLAGSGMPTAASFGYANLPENLRKRHGPIDTRAAEVIRSLSDHSSITLSGIKTTIGGMAEIARDALSNRVLDALNENQVVLISAPAGLGKSAVAKNCMELLDRDLYCLAFRAEEFSVSHIDQALHQAQVRANGAEILEIMAGQGRKLALVESLERLLEAPVRDAFADLLNLAKRDRSLGVLITCRDYSLETVTSALLCPAGLEFKVIEVPSLTNEELDQVVASMPHLSYAFLHKELKRLLRSPYLLDKAAQMDWLDTGGLPANEREFRKRCWREVIRRDAAATAGLSERRDRVFEEVALRRARQLRQFVGIEDLDADALGSLRNDGLLAFSPDAGAMAAPSHDVLEDWAIIQWLGRRWILNERSAKLLAEDVGGYPAIRRAYKMWFSELLQGEPGVAMDFVLSVFQDGDLPTYFRDDTLVCTLQSPSARDFLERNREPLLKDSGQLLVRVIHLMRVSCKSTLWGLSEDARLSSQMLVASGDCWPTVLDLVLREIDRLLPCQTPILLGLIEDFANSIDWCNPEPKGYEESTKIGFQLIEHLDNFRMEDMRKRTLKVIAKGPRGDEKAFRALVERAIAKESRDGLADEVSGILLSGVEGWTACRYFPEEITRLAKSRFLLPEEGSDSDDWRCGSSPGIERYFGIQDHTYLDWFPASSIRGPFLPLLRYHPRQGLDFIIELLNHAGRWYGEPRWSYDRLEPAQQIIIEVPGEVVVKQWANQRLWGLYRGHEVGPYVLQTALMALEAWLLELCGCESVEIEPWLLKVLRESNNVMATAVVASVCNMHPDKAGRAGLALLSSPELIWMDRVRIVKERPHSAISEIFPSFGINEIYEDEREKSDGLSHRGHDLEVLAVNMQLTDSREQVFALIDAHRAALPPVEEQLEEHRLWRLALHRMDVRGFSEVEERISEGEESRERRILLGPGEIEPDVQALVDRHAPIAAQQERECSLLNWGTSAWVGQESSHLDISDWKTFLALARGRDAEPEPEDFLRGGVGVIAAFCVRDHWDEMRPEDQEWCIEKLIQEVKRHSDTEDNITQVARGSYRPDRCAAYVLPSLLACDVSEAQTTRIIEAIAIALTHAVNEVVVHAAEGIGAVSAGEMWGFSEACIAAIAWQARLISGRLAEERKRPFGEQVRVVEIAREVVPSVRAAIIARNRDLQTELKSLDLNDWPWSQATKLILQILGYAPDSVLAIEFHRRIACSIVEEWDQELKDSSTRGKRDYEFMHEFYRRFSRFVLKLGQKQALQVCGPFLEAVSRHPKEIKGFIHDLVVEADARREGDSFWAIWQAFADRIVAAPWIERLDSRYNPGNELVGAIFLVNFWKQNVHHWHRLGDLGHLIDDLSARFRGSAVVFDAYCQFLYNIGQRSLPKAFVVLKDSLAAGDPSVMLANGNIVFLLESLLRRYVYAEPHRLKSDPALRKAVLALLEYLVEKGSSAAYRMRDDFVTPLSGDGTR